MDPSAFPSNSKHSPPKEEKKVERVVASEVVSKKKSLGKRLKEILIGGDSQSVLNYVVMDVIVPQVRDMIAEAASQGVERMVYGDSRGPRRPSTRPAGSSPGYTNYNRYSGRGNNPIGQSGRAERPMANVRTKALDDILFASRVEAETVQDRMYDLLNQYGQVSVADLYSLIDWSSSHTDQKWGWETLQGSNIQRVRDGYILNLPKPEYLD